MGVEGGSWNITQHSILKYSQLQIVSVNMPKFLKLFNSVIYTKYIL